MEKLPKYLFEYLLEAVRRDMRHQDLEAVLAAGDEQRTFCHGYNARRDREILQLLRPKE
jgi:hypothetical protein